MIELNISNLTKYYGGNKIFQDISFEIQTGERIGLIGQNGCGKTTIMKILMGMEEYQGGNISLKKNNKVGYLNQIPYYEDGTTTLQVLQSAFAKISDIKKQMEELEWQLGHLEGDQLDKAVTYYSKLQEQYEYEGGYELETKLNKITEGLMITDGMKMMKFNELSGGEKTRIILAKILLEAPDILLLDEPTNHLDLITIEWLEDFLKSYKGAALIISHDRYFLDHVVNKIIELEFDHAEVYLGNYSYYVIEKERRFLLGLKNYQNQQKKINRMEQQIERYRIWGKMRDSEVMFKRAKELEKRLEKIEVLDRPMESKRKIRLDHATASRSGKIVLETTALGKWFQDKILFKEADIHVFYQDSICILGKNGSGKTTLLKTILGELDPEEGFVKIGAQVIIGYLPQQVEFPDEEQTVLEYFARLHNLTNGLARSQLAKALFSNESVNKKIKYLSGGEKSRLKLCSLTFTGVNCLVLDEPTNHLDIDSREVLEETLEEYEGTIVFVSHDRYFINKIADKIIAIDNGRVKKYDGDYRYYLEEKNKELEADTKQYICNNTAGSKQEKIKDGSNGNNALPLQIKLNENNKYARNLALLEKNIEEMEDKLKNLEEMMNLHNSDSIRLREIFEEKEMLQAELEHAYTQWETLQ